MTTTINIHDFIALRTCSSSPAYHAITSTFRHHTGRAAHQHPRGDLLLGSRAAIPPILHLPRRRPERLRRVHASSAAATFHAKLAAAQKNVREPLGRTRALHHGAEGDAADHCWQPARREEPASDGGTLDDELRRRLGVG